MFEKLIIRQNLLLKGHIRYKIDLSTEALW